MFKLIASYLATGKMRFEDGFVLLAGQRMLFIPDNVISGVQKKLQNQFGWQKGANLTYMAFKEGGREISNAIREKENLKGSEIVKWIANVASASGWGKISLVDYNPETKKAIISILKSPFPQFFQKNKPCCYITKALIAGTLSTVFNLDIEGVETECLSQGKKECIMIFQPKKEWKKVKSPLLKKEAKLQLPELF